MKIKPNLQPAIPTDQATPMTSSGTTGIVIIGRNEGDRLIRCLSSVTELGGHVVYVDSGSTDRSQEVATATGAHLVNLDQDQPFTAARARNAGLGYLKLLDIAPDYVQFIDGDCELQQGWLETARIFLDANPVAAVVCGRRRERYPEASIYNRLIDQEWNTPVGKAKACGGDALIRLAALDAVGGFNPYLIAGEEPELCVRLRQTGWCIWRLDAEMTLHDAALTRFSQWWKRNQRAGHAFAEGATMHGAAPEYHGVRQTRSALLWGGTLPFATLLGLIVGPWSLVLLLAWPGQVIRLARRDHDWSRALFLTLGKIPEAQGVLGFWLGRVRGVRAGLIEYK